MRLPGGFTLVETILAASLLCLAFALCLPFLHLQRQVLTGQQSRAEEFETFTSALGWICRDLQEAGYRWDGAPLQEVEADSIQYVLTRDEEAAGDFTADNRRLIGVYRNGQDLMYRIRRWSGEKNGWERGSVQKLASGVTTLRFRGFDKSGALAGRPSDVAAVEIMLQGERSGTLRTFVTLRNGRGARGR